ncbi:hypothetical protein [Pseudorhodoplanes sp.]|uniref:hypothetical protein n=1 Tax=Pseudorhodoplanes sp. TaxID=1934341 RepID=UPI003D106D00
MAGEDDENWWIEEGISKEEVDFVNALVASKVRQAPPEEIHELMREAQLQLRTQGTEELDRDLFELAFFITPTKRGPMAPGQWFNWEGFWEKYRQVETGIEPDSEIGGGDDIRRVAERGAERLAGRSGKASS